MIDKEATVYGLKTCDTCRKAVRALTEAGYQAQLVDIRAEPLSGDVLTLWLERLGPGLLNTRSTTWRGLDEPARALPPLDLLQAHAALMKRPVIAFGDDLYLGWGKDVQAVLLA
ncbi:MAG: arsenate reductase [Mangrovicoccus sp.]|nr:arsenate reductase [Mangrovicoccus sp.]